MHFVNKIEWPVLAFFAYLSKVLILGANIADSVLMFPVCALVGYHLYIKHIKTKPLEERFAQEIKSIEQKFRKDFEILNEKVGNLQTKQQITQINTDPAKRYF